jgi:small neutral amino acid transporter SnatA (MarC family)
LAAILAALGPATIAVVVSLAVNGPAARITILVSAVAAYLVAYRFSLLLVRWFGGEYDPRASSGYRRRP